MREMTTNASSVSDITERHHSPQHLIYDQISCIEDTPANSDPKTSSVVGTAVFFTSCIIISLIGGFGLNLAINSKKYRESWKENDKTPKPVERVVHVVGRGGRQKVVLEDPVILATRALGWGTLFSLIGTGTIGLTLVGVWKL